MIGRRVSLSEFLAEKAQARARKAKRAAKAKELAQARPGATSQAARPIKSVLGNRTAVKKALWEVTSLLVRRRDSRVHDGLCLICVSRPIQLAYHVLPANEGSAAKWSLDNIVGACGPCNFGERNWRLRYAEKHRQIFGEARYAALKAIAATTVKYSTADLREMLEQRKRMIQTGIY